MKKFKTFIAGIMVGVLIAASPALANTLMEMISVERNLVKVTVDGNATTGDNFLYDGRTYVPLREVAETLGKTVEWNSETNTANITDSFGVVFKGDIVGFVNSSPVTTQELETYKVIVNSQHEDSKLTEDEITEKAKEKIVRDRVVVEIAKNEGFKIDKDFESQYALYIEYFNSQLASSSGTNNGFNQLLEVLGYTPESYKRMQEISYLEGLLIEKNSENYRPLPDEIAKFYFDNKESFRFDGLRCKHILFKTMDSEGKDLSEEQISSIKAKADSVYNDLVKGANFDELMKKHSEDGGLESNPDGYIFTKGEMVKEFETAAYNLKVGEISKPVKSIYGYHIIKLEEKIEFHDVEDPSVVASIENKIKNNKFNKEIEDKLISAVVSWN